MKKKLWQTSVMVIQFHEDQVKCESVTTPMDKSMISQLDANNREH